MKKLTRRIGVGVMAASLVMSSSVVAFAADSAGSGSTTGSGEIEGIVKTDVYQAVLPTITADTTYKYIADPQGLIRKTDAAKYSGAEFGEGTLFFANTGGSYSNTSDAAKIVNQSSKNLSVSVTAKATAGSGATLAANKEFSGTDKEVYLGITDSVEGNAETALTAAGATMTAVLGAAPEDAYEYSYDESNGYGYTLKSDVSAFQFAEYSFQITGAANDKATDWAADTALPSIDVTWTVDLTDDEATVATPDQTPVAPSAPATATYSKADGAEIEVDLGAGNLGATGIASIKAKNTATGNLYDAASASYANGKITITAAQWAAAPVGSQRWVVVTFDDAAATTQTIVVTVAE